MGFRATRFSDLHSRELTWKPKRGPMKTPVPLKGGYMGFHVSLGECRELRISGLKVQGLPSFWRGVFNLGGHQNCGPFLDPYCNTAPNI